MATLVSFVAYLYPLFDFDNLYVLTFDNLDSNIIWYKILASSGKIFAENSDIVPNMMSGLPRSSYGGEFSVMLWLHYLLTPQWAYSINEAIIHLVALLSMFVFLKRYIIAEIDDYAASIIYMGSIFFAFTPFWSGAGVTIAAIPLVTYSYANIRAGIDTKWDWILLATLPLYASFVLFYIFYIAILGMVLLYDTVRSRSINKRFFLSILLLTSVFMLTNYRLILAMFFDGGFVSHRTEFAIFFQDSLLSAYRKTHTFFLNGHPDHLLGTQMPYVIPIVIIGLLLTLTKRRYSSMESMIIWLIIISSFAIGAWSHLLAQLYTMSFLLAGSLILYLFSQTHRVFISIFILQILLIFFIFFEFYEGFYFLSEIFPILKAFNVSRFSFIQPLLWSVLLVYALVIIKNRVMYFMPFLLLFGTLQIYHSLELRFFSDVPQEKYATFDDYYAPELFDKIKKAIPQPAENIKVVSLGIEPAVTLYNGFYTVDGYCVNYPLSYKHKFNHVTDQYTSSDTFARWGSKVHISGISSVYDVYRKDLMVSKPLFSIDALCSLGTDYIISSYKLNITKLQHITYIDSFYGKNNSWDITLYRLNCQETDRTN